MVTELWEESTGKGDGFGSEIGSIVRGGEAVSRR
jgi:hypothetical protein